MDDDDFEPPIVDAAAVVLQKKQCRCFIEERHALVGEGFATMLDFLVVQAKYVPTTTEGLQGVEVAQLGDGV